MAAVKGFTGGKHGNRLITCSGCGKRKWSANDSGASGGDGNLCAACYDEAGLINEHADGHHDTPNAECPDCKAEAEGPPCVTCGHPTQGNQAMLAGVLDNVCMACVGGITS